MEDSLEAFLKISKNKIDEPSISNKDIHMALKKKECDQRALKIVEFSIEGKLRPEVFIKCLPYIMTSHYQDIVEERSVTKLCGYSVCGKRIPEMPKKQYFISTKSNKVYDITDRKNYCSNFCYKASLHLKAQIDDSPLWLRKFEKVSEYHLLAPGDRGLPGALIEQGIAKPTTESTFTPVNAFAEVSLQDMVDHEKGDNSKKGKNKRFKSHATMQTISENSEQIQDDEEEEPKNPLATVKIDVKRSANFLPIIEENEENIDTNESLEKKENSSHSNQNTRKTKRKHPKNQSLEMETLLKKLLKGWLTLESYVFLFGEKRVKEILDEKKLSDYFDKLNISELQQNQQAKYLEICKRLRLQQIADEKFDEAILGNKTKSPVPDYQKLKKETKELNVKVKSFLGGTMYEKEDTNFPIKENSRNSNESGDPSLFTPMVDVNSQKALRRKIFLQSITKLMQKLLQTLQLEYVNTLSDLQGLVKTFQLTAQTIVFKPLVWKYISVTLLHMLSLRDDEIKNTLHENGTKDKLELYLGVPYMDKFIDDIMCEICDIDRFVQEYICSV